jgi:hypothetical protein
MSDDERLVAFHEAGHAAIAVRLNIPIARVSLAPPGLGLGAGGYVVVSRGPLTTAEADLICLNRPDAIALGSLPIDLFGYAIFLLSGAAAERRAGGGRDGGWQDQRTVETLFAAGFGIEAVSARVVDLVGRFEVAADRAVEKEWKAITRVADALLERKTLDAAQIMAAMNGG